MYVGVSVTFEVSGFQTSMALSRSLNLRIGSDTVEKRTFGFSPLLDRKVLIIRILLRVVLFC